jgi:multidrug efflux pump subunit AcrB
MGEVPGVAAEKGGQEVSMAVLAATLTSAVVFFPVIFLYGVSRFLFSALALTVVLALFASYFVAMTVVPLFCARYISAPHSGTEGSSTASGASRLASWLVRFNRRFSQSFQRLLGYYEARIRQALDSPKALAGGILSAFVLSLALYPSLGVAFFP